MDIAKEKFFEVRYNTKLDRLVLKEEKWINKIKKAIKKHKLITTIGITLVIFSCLNFFMIYSFIKILQNI